MAGRRGLQSTGWRDVDGWIDCNDSCNRWNYLGAATFWAPVFMGVLLLFVVAVIAGTRLYRRVTR